MCRLSTPFHPLFRVTAHMDIHLLLNGTSCAPTTPGRSFMPPSEPCPPPLPLPPSSVFSPARTDPLPQELPPFVLPHGTVYTGHLTSPQDLPSSCSEISDCDGASSLTTTRRSGSVESFRTFLPVPTSPVSPVSAPGGLPLPHPSPLVPEEPAQASSQQCSSYGCSQCDLSFPTIAQLVRHQKSHREPSFVCDDCGASFKWKHSLQRHKRVVEQKMRPYKCRLCPMRFGEKSNMCAHERHTHMGIKPFSCQICKAAFSKKSHVIRHARALHEIVDDLSKVAAGNMS